jgi:hypothetical protein
VNQAGNWEAFVYIPNRYHGSKSARYQIHYAGGSAQRIVNQNNYYNQWVSLGTYYFDGGADEYVYLDDVTGETYGTRFVGFDAVKFVKLGAWPPPPGPTPPPSGCAITPVLGLGNVWFTYSQVRDKIGCATAAEVTVWGAEEPFQGGYMFWRSDETYVYVLYNNGTWQGYDDTWVEGEPPFDPGIVPPYGYYQPIRGFGKVWRNNLAVRNGLGWATTEERGLYGAIQPFEHGVMLWSSTRGVYVLYSDGRWELYS